ncbi:Cytochrome P450 monooxygenase [Lachnellula willkommii]|uniref:Cytochrome P450 monooxygenase n=1 Tax=Lachnellula willkommii TaxID=215461 RepID=A0A559MIW4_9HELO|nr:Cytochrome P450 monooxygenase [Lachnellula willkommii]
MDLLKCAVVSVVEVYACTTLNLQQVQGYHPLSLVLLLLLTQYLALKLSNIFIYPFRLSPLRHIPGPKGDNPLLGSALEQLRAGPGVLELSWCRTFPDAKIIRYFGVGNQEYVLLNSRKAHRDVLQKNCYDFQKPHWLARIVGEIAGTGLLFAEGDFHKKQRRLLTGQYSGTSLVYALAARKHELMRMLEQVLSRSAISKIYCRSLKPNLRNYATFLSDHRVGSSLLMNTTLDVIGLAVLGRELSALSVPSPFAEHYDTLFATSNVGNLIAVIHQAIPIRWALPIKVNRDFLHSRNQIRVLLLQHIRKRKEELALTHNASTQDQSNSGSSRDLLTLMIEEKLDVSDGWTEDDILGHLLNFMAAGHETSAGALTWALHALSIYPHIQFRLRDEVLNSAAAGPSPTEAELDSLNYLSNFLREVLRYYTPALSTPREAIKDVTIDGVFLPKGTNVIIVPSLPHFDIKTWGPSVDEFNPDRFTNLPKEAQDPWATQTFLGGPRICIGKSFAMLEMKAIMVALIKEFEFSSLGFKVEQQKGGQSRRPAGGLKLRIKKFER